MHFTKTTNDATWDYFKPQAGHHIKEWKHRRVAPFDFEHHSERDDWRTSVAHTRSASDGSFELGALSPGRHVLRASADDVFIGSPPLAFGLTPEAGDLGFEQGQLR